MLVYDSLIYNRFYQLKWINFLQIWSSIYYASPRLNNSDFWISIWLPAKIIKYIYLLFYMHVNQPFQGIQENSKWVVKSTNTNRYNIWNLPRQVGTYCLRDSSGLPNCNPTSNFSRNMPLGTQVPWTKLKIWIKGPQALTA